jgi:hypothetical protein
MRGMMNLFSNVQTSAREEVEMEKSLRGKTDKDIKIGSKFSSGSVEKGEQSFSRIADKVAGDRSGFHFFPQKDQQSFLVGSSNQNNPIR